MPKEKIVEGMESNAESQRRRSMTRDERARDAVNHVAENVYKQADRDGQRLSYEQAQSQAAAIAEREDRRKGR